MLLGRTTQVATTGPRWPRLLQDTPPTRHRDPRSAASTRRFKRSVKRPRLTHADRGLWVLLSRRWASWSDALIIVKPDTVIRWHRAGFRKYWAWRSRPKGGRPAIDPQIRALIRSMATANMWSAPMRTGDARRTCVGTRNRDTWTRSCPWTYSRCRRCSSTSCLCSSCRHTVAGKSSTSMSLPTRARSGRRNRSPTPSHRTRRLAPCCVTAMGAMAPSSEIA